MTPQHAHRPSRVREWAERAVFALIVIAVLVLGTVLL